MDDKDKLIKELNQKIYSLESRVEYLQGIILSAKIPHKINQLDEGKINIDARKEDQGNCIYSEVITKNHVKFFYSMFKGRKDVYSKRGSKVSPKSGKTGYYTQCWNFWKDGICPKKTGKKIKCSECKNQCYKPLKGDDLLNHLNGKKEDSSDVIGLYPMLANEMCNFLVFDFDNHDEKSNGDDFANCNDEWIDEVNAMRTICKNNNISVLVERSRSGKGAHIWLFFEESVPASIARKFGASLLTKGAESVNQKNFKFYDRMLPAQDNLPDGGLGNLIALPLQGQALKKGNSAFIDENWNAYPNQWQILKDTKKLSKSFIEERINEWTSDGILGILADDMSGNAEKSDNVESRPWEKYNIDTIDLFGSYTNGNATEKSDIDFLVKFVVPVPSIFAVMGFKEELEQKLKMPVDVVTLPITRPEKIKIEKTIRIYEK